MILPNLGPYRVGFGDVREKLSKVAGAFFGRMFIKMRCDENVTSQNFQSPLFQKKKFNVR